jgi:hypothetical protein
MTSDDPGTLLRTVTAALERASIPHMVVGSFASTVHGWVEELHLQESWNRARALTT